MAKINTEQIINILIVLVVIGAAVMGLFYLFGDNLSGNEEVETTDSSAVSQTSARLISLVRTLDNISLAKDVFSREDINAMRDVIVPIPPESLGTPNPFGIRPF